VEAFNASPSHGRFQQRQHDDVESPTKLHAATSFEEDLALTLKIIMDHDKRSTTVSKEQFIQQMEKVSEKEIVEEIDVSVPYDAAARLAYSLLEEKENISFQTFEAKYREDVVAMVKSKQPEKEVADVVVDVSVPYDAAARLAYSLLLDDKQNISFKAFEAKYLEDTVSMVKSKQPKKEGDDAPPLAASTSSSDTTTVDATAPAPAKTSSVAGVNTNEKPLLQTIVSSLWNKVSPIRKKFSKA